MHLSRTTRCQGERPSPRRRCRDFQPGWSADGARIAFTSERDGNRELYIMAPDGSGLVRLTEDADEDSQPVWSPALAGDASES